MSNADNKYPLLPKLSKGSKLSPNTAGSWSVSQSLTDMIASFEGKTEGNVHIDSIPSVWAKPILFQMALLEDPKGEYAMVTGLKEKVTGEWRSLLAMLALKNIKNLPLKATLIELEDVDNSIGSILSRLSPIERLSGADGWKYIYVLEYNDKPIAITSPTTLVATAADYEDALAENGIDKPWASGNVLIDPTSYLTDEDKQALCGWLKKLRDDISKLPNLNKISEELLGVINEYIADVEKAIGKKNTIDVYFEDDDDLILNLNKDIFYILNNPVKPPQASAKDSDFRLKKSRGSKEILLISKDVANDMSDKLREPLHQLIVWQGISANDILSMENFGTNRGQLGNVKLENAEWRAPDDFFYDTITVAQGKFQGSLEISEMVGKNGESVILPIKPELLEIYTPGEIKDRLRVECLENSRYAISFNFIIKGKDSEYKYKFKKEYTSDKVKFIDNVPILSIWPNFKRANWNKYYIYYENKGGQSEKADIADYMFYVAPYKYENPKISEDYPDRGLKNRFTVKMNDFPEALICTVRCSDENFAEIETSGMILLKEPEAVIENPEISYSFAVDFGTSSTMLYYKRMRSGKDSEALPCVFDPDMIFDVTEAQKDQKVRMLMDFISPLKDSIADGSFLSIFQTLNPERLNDIKQDKSKNIEPLMDGNILKLSLNALSLFNQNADRIDTDLKWKQERGGKSSAIAKKKMRAFLEQICLQNAAMAAKDGASDVEWNFSYPTAFAGTTSVDYGNACNDMVKEAVKNTCFEKISQNINTNWPESKAMAYYFKSREGTSIYHGAISLDIGAGTTDISVISGKKDAKIVYHTSIKFAGRSLFSPLYAENVYSHFNNTLDLTNLKSDQRGSAIDADMRENSDKYLKNLPDTIDEDDAILNALQSSQFAVAGIFYYLGIILKTLKQKGIYEEDEVPNIFVGGNGSRIFQWINCGVNFNSRDNRLNVIKKAIIESSGLKGDDITITLNDKPKIEVASGMLQRLSREDSNFFNATEIIKNFTGTEPKDEIVPVISGESFEVGGEKRGKEDVISAKDIFEGIEIGDLEEIKHFIEMFNNAGYILSDGINIEDLDIERDIKNRVGDKFIEKRNDEDVKKPQDISVEPVFIVALREIMEKI